MKSTEKQLNSQIVYNIVSRNYSKKRLFTQKEITKKFLKYKIKHHNTSEKTKLESVQPTVSRLLNDLIKKERLAKTKDRKYIPFNENVRKQLVADEIIDKITFAKRDIFQISESTIAVGVASKDLFTAKNLFFRYLSEKNCYDILEINTYLVIMLKTSIDINATEKKYFDALPKGVNQSDDEEVEKAFNNDMNPYLRELFDLRVEISEIVKSAYDNAIRKKQKKQTLTPQK